MSSERVSATDRDALVHHTSEVVSALCFDHLVSGPPCRCEPLVLLLVACRSKLTAVYAESQDEKRERHDSMKAECLMGEIAVERDIMGQPRPSSSLCHEITQLMPFSFLLRSPRFWLPTLPTERHVHGKCCVERVRGPHLFWRVHS